MVSDTGAVRILLCVRSHRTEIYQTRGGKKVSRVQPDTKHTTQ